MAYVGRIRLVPAELGLARCLVGQVTYNRYLGVRAQFSCHLRSVVLFLLRQVRHESAYACIVVHVKELVYIGSRCFLVRSLNKMRFEDVARGSSVQEHISTERR